MRVTALFALLFTLCLQSILAADPDYVTQWLPNDLEPLNPNSQVPPINIQYWIKKPNTVQPNSPVFYGVGGRVTVEDIKKQYTLFDNQFKDLNVSSSGTVTPTIVYVEQRHFGKSNNVKINTLAELADLKLDNVLNDHVKLIKKLSKDLGTKNFLVFGGGHGGVIAGYLANKFATDTTDTTLSSYNVLAWSSSPPIKYLRLDTDNLTINLQELGQKLVTLLKASDCTDADISNFNNLFTGIKALRSGDADSITLIRDINLEPKPKLETFEGSDLKQLAIYIRNQMIGLTFDNNPYDPLGKPNKNRKLKQLCTAIKPITGALSATLVNAVLFVFNPNTDDRTIYNWRLTDRNGIYTDQAAALYQDCTEYQLAYCPKDSTTTSDPFTGSQWNTALPCTTLAEYQAVIKAECQGLFGDTTFDTEGYLLNSTAYPRSLNNRVITTINKQSIFGLGKFDDSDYDYSKYSTYWSIESVDNWEFQTPRICDSEKVKDIRYLVLRAFGCLTGFIQNDNDICNTTTLFKDGNYEDKLAVGDCLLSTDVNSTFPFGHAAVNFVGTHLPSTSTTTVKILTVPTGSTIPQPKATSPKFPATTTDGVGSLAPMACVLFTSLFVWFTAKIVV